MQTQEDERWGPTLTCCKRLERKEESRERKGSEIGSLASFCVSKSWSMQSKALEKSSARTAVAVFMWKEDSQCENMEWTAVEQENFLRKPD